MFLLELLALSLYNGDDFMERDAEMNRKIYRDVYKRQPTDMPPVSDIANHDLKECSGRASLPPILRLPIFEKVTAATEIRQTIATI